MINFPDCGTTPLGLYPIVDEAAWLETLLPLGITTIQLRIKDKQERLLEEEIKRAIAIANQWNARLFINDYWELALRYGAYGVHLGQEDLKTADLKRIQEAGLRLGISTHTGAEIIDTTEIIRASYIACGPVFPTTTKVMPYSPVGLLQLEAWRRGLNVRTVAIGGITLGRMPGIVATGVDGIAMISAITKAENPVSATRELLRVMREYA